MAAQLLRRSIRGVALAPSMGVLAGLGPGGGARSLSYYSDVFAGLGNSCTGRRHLLGLGVLGNVSTARRPLLLPRFHSSEVVALGTGTASNLSTNTNTFRGVEGQITGLRTEMKQQQDLVWEKTRDFYDKATEHRSFYNGLLVCLVIIQFVLVIVFVVFLYPMVNASWRADETAKMMANRQLKVCLDNIGGYIEAERKRKQSTAMDKKLEGNAAPVAAGGAAEKK